MSQQTVDFAISMIKRQEALRESAKPQTPIKESTKPLKEGVEDEELKDEELIPADTGAEETPEEKPEEETVIEDGENFEESLSDNVFFCATCKKHFIATADTPKEDIVCPVCNESGEIIAMGSAEEALDDEENSEVAVELEDSEGDGEGDGEAPPTAPADELKFDESDLEEGFRHLAKKHLGEKTMLRIKEGTIAKNGSVILEGRTLPTKKTFNIVFEGFRQNSKKNQFVLEGSTSLFNKGNKLRALFVREGNVFKVKKCGYGFIKESVQGKQKVKGILG